MEKVVYYRYSFIICDYCEVVVFLFSKEVEMGRVSCYWLENIVVCMRMWCC